MDKNKQESIQQCNLMGNKVWTDEDLELFSIHANKSQGFSLSRNSNIWWYDEIEAATQVWEWRTAQQTLT